jgi:pyruvate,water dikinase
MLKTGNEWKQKNIKDIDESDLLDCLVERGKEYRRWLKAYDEYCIPFAHGVRLFGEIYNSKLNPDDPYEFVDLLRTGELLSLKRNQKIVDLSRSLLVQHSDIETLKIIVEIFGYKYKDMSEVPDKLLNLIESYTDVAKPECSKNTLEELFINSFTDEEKTSMEELLDLGRASYRIRDDDNIYLDGVKRGLESIIKEASSRISNDCFNEEQKNVIEKELAKGIPELHSPNINNNDKPLYGETIKFRQLVGQPAGKGIAKGYARVINKFDDLFAFKKDEVLVCDAVEPEMTIVAPLASAVIERRGGMLIHGAIIAREYGLPCVTGVPEATKKIKTGDLLSVDGWLGIITIL